MQEEEWWSAAEDCSSLLGAVGNGTMCHACGDSGHHARGCLGQNDSTAGAAAAANVATDSFRPRRGAIRGLGRGSPAVGGW